FFIGDDGAIRVIDGRREYRACQDLEEAMRVDARLASEREGFAQTFDIGRDQEVAGELDQVCLRLALAQHEKFLNQGIEKWPAGGEGSFGASRDDEELARDCGLRSSKDRCRDIELTRIPVFLCQSMRQGGADRAHRNVDRILWQGGENAAVLEHN